MPISRGAGRGACLCPCSAPRRCARAQHMRVLRDSVAMALAVLATLACGCGSESDTAAPAARRFAVLSAFPAELAPHLDRAKVDETMVIENRVFRTGTLDGVPVVMALTGIGLVNAATTTRLLLDHFDVDGIVVSAVAGGGNQTAIA